MTLPASFLDRAITHRGLHDVTDGRAENSPKAFAAAMDHGYGIELDLQLSSDGVPMVFHDYELSRLTDETGAVAQRTASELGTIALKYDGDGIPTLAQVLTQVAGRVPLLIELKDQDGQLGPNIGPLGAATAELLRNYDGDVAVMSFNPYAVAEFIALLPDVPRGLVAGPFRPKNWPTIPAPIRKRLRKMEDYTKSGSSFISYRDTHLNKPQVLTLKEAGAAILCWTVKSPEAETAAREIADNITFEGYLA